MPDLLLRMAYLLNLFILVPVLFFMFTDSEQRPLRVFESKVKNGDGLRLLIASLWSSILILSLLGFAFPRFFLVVLILQVIYKAIYLAVYIAPRAIRYGIAQIPLGISISFIVIVLLYPLIIAYSLCAA